MDYNSGQGDLQNWLVKEPEFNPKFQGKCEAIFALGNGHIGVRSSTEEQYVGQVRNFFVSGTFNKAYENEVTELPNVADVLGMNIKIDGDLFNLEKGSYDSYHRTLNLKTGEVNREFIWTNKGGKKLKFQFRKFVSFNDLHLIASELSITPIDCNIEISITSGIDGQVTNSGAQHFVEGEKRIYDGKYLQMTQTTNESGIEFVQNAVHELKSEGAFSSRFEMDRRQLHMLYDGTVSNGQNLKFEKVSNVFTTRDQSSKGKSFEEIKVSSLDLLKTQAAKGYDLLLHESASTLGNFWSDMDIKIDSQNDFDQLAIRFAQFQLLVMTPKHDNRCGIGAKGLSGEGYKGHSFWDTEIFILPFFTYTFPEIAKSLLEYRYNTIVGARQKAKDNGYKGAMYPWESAWADDGEVTPVWGAVDIITGEATKIWSGFIEQHITSDIAFAVWQYYKITGDEDFMKRCGFEILLDTGIFWTSRLEWDEKSSQYHINDVVGPDEYKEHVNNDAFTNYTAKWCMENALEYYELLKKGDKETFNRLNDQLNLDSEIAEIKSKYDLIYLPEPNEDLVIPQDDTYLSKELIDLSKYKKQTKVGLLFQDYNLDQVNEIQVSKQASVVMLMYLLEHKFNQDIKISNYNYYEPKTLHDSSLSLSTHAVLAADVDKLELAYELFERASRIDLGPNMTSSNHGLHAASLGGIWQIVVCGFGGLRMIGGNLRICPKLPTQIKSISYPLYWQGKKLRVEVDEETINITTQSNDSVKLTVFESEYDFTNNLSINYKTEKVL